MQPAISKPYKGMGMEGRTAKWYANLTRKSMDEFKTLARRVADRLPAGGKVLEVAPGPGYFAIELAKLGNYQVTGLDISHTFVDIARRNASDAGVSVDFHQGNAAAIPFADQSFDFILCRAAFKNFSEPVRALQEMYRVLAKGGQALIIDLRARRVPRFDQSSRRRHARGRRQRLPHQADLPLHAPQASLHAAPIRAIPCANQVRTH